MTDPGPDPDPETTDPGPPAEVLAAAFPDREVRVLGRLEGRATNGVYELVVGGDRDPVTGGDRVVLKLTDRAGWRLRKEAAILRAVAPVDGVPVPGVVAGGSAGGTQYLVTGFCDGSVAADAVPPTGDGAREFLAGLGRTLARVHDAVGFDRPGNPVATEGGLRVDGADDWVGSLAELLDAEARILRGTPFESAGDRARSLLDAHRDRVADPSEVRLLHSDPNPGNVFVEDGRITCVIDWEYATAGDPAWDCCSAEWSCIGKGPFDTADAGAILAGYREVRSIPGGFDRRRTLYRALLPVGTMVGLAGGSEAEEGSVTATPGRIRALLEEFEDRVAAVEDA